VRILFLSPWNPYPPVFGARLRVLSLLWALATRERREVDLLSFAEPGDDLQASQVHLARFGIRARFVRRPPEKRPRIQELPARLAAAARGVPFNAHLCRHPEMRRTLQTMVRERVYDLVVAETSWMGQHAAPLRGLRKLLSWQNVDFAVYARRAETDTNPLLRAVRRYNHRTARHFEMELVPRFDGLLTVTEADRRFLRDAGVVATPVHVVPICVDTEQCRFEGDAEREPGLLVFVGAMFYEPNVDAVTYFHRDIYGLIRARAPGVRFVIVGRDPTEAVRRLAREDPSVTVTGTVDDVREYYRRGRVFVAPVRQGGGMKTKVVEAMAGGLPVVASSFALEGIEARDGREVLIADEAEAFATGVVSLLNDSRLRQGLALAARALVERSYSWDALARILDGILGERNPA